jgi:hypothetical protein
LDDAFDRFVPASVDAGGEVFTMASTEVTSAMLCSLVCSSASSEPWPFVCRGFNFALRLMTIPPRDAA